FIEPEVLVEDKWRDALDQIEILEREVIAKNSEMVHITKWEQLNELKQGQIGALLTLVGANARGNALEKLYELYRRGILSIGVTWNNANVCADGVEEPRGAGLTALGNQVVQSNNERGVLTDVAHASEKTFWDVIDVAKYPFASHSNARAICDHPRNLYDDQIKAVLNKGGLMQVVFHPPFIKENSDTATISDLIKHIDHICSLGGVKQIGFGSDFDGIERVVTKLEHSGQYTYLIDELLKYYSEEEIRGFAHQNFINFCERIV